MATRRGRPRKFDDQMVRQAILRTFWEKGYAATSLDDLSKATGLVRPSLYGAFGGKIDMYLMSMDVFLEKLADVRAALSSAETAGAALEAFYLRMLDLYFGEETPAQLGCFLVGTALTEAPSNPDIREALAERMGRFNQLLAAALHARLPEAGAEDIRFAADQAAATLHSIAVRTRAGEDKERLRAFAQRSARFIANSLSA